MSLKPCPFTDEERSYGPRANETAKPQWNETQVNVREVLDLAPVDPLFGHVSGRKGLTHWLVFMKWATEK